MSLLAAMLERRRAEIIQRWTGLVQGQLAPEGATKAEIIDHLPDFLKHLEAGLRGAPSEDGRSPETASHDVGRAHGGQRFRLGFPLDELVHEYGVLRELLLDVMEEEGLQVTLGEVRLMTRFVAEAITEGVKEHTRQREVARREAQEALDAERERAERSRRALLEALDAQPLVAVCYQRGPEHVFEMANPLYRQLLDREVVGLSPRQALPDIVAQGFLDLLTRVRESGVPWLDRAVPVRVEQGQSRPPHEFLCDFIYQPVRAADGSVEGILTLAVDVTEQVHLRRAAELLAREERERRELEQHLIGIVSHDLRNPLSAILLGVQMLLRREPDARTVPSLVRIQSSAERAVRMVRDLLDFTQARLGGGLKIVRGRVDLHALVRGVVEENQVTHPERELRLEQRGEGIAAWDADRIAQLLGNLLGNALKYSPADSPVTMRSVGGPEGVRLEVHNQGEPIAPEAMKKLFQPLQRAVEGTDVVGRSVGLGLYIVDQIVRAHGGDVQVTSSAREGTTFTVRLPRQPA